MQTTPPPRAHGRLLLAPFLNAKSLPWLRRNSVTHIVNATPDAPCLFRGEFRYLRVPVEDRDGADLSSHFARCHAYASYALSGGGTVLFHCAMGRRLAHSLHVAHTAPRRHPTGLRCPRPRSRSAALLVAFLLREEGLGVAQALDYVRSLRASAAPRVSFLRQLREYAAGIAEAAAAGAEARGALAELDRWLGSAPPPLELALVPAELVAAVAGEGAALAVCEGRLAVSVAALGALWRGASEAWRAERRRGHECCSAAAAATALPPAAPPLASLSAVGVTSARVARGTPHRTLSLRRRAAPSQC